VRGILVHADDGRPKLGLIDILFLQIASTVEVDDEVETTAAHSHLRREVEREIASCGEGCLAARDGHVGALIELRAVERRDTGLPIVLDVQRECDEHARDPESRSDPLPCIHVREIAFRGPCRPFTLALPAS
jgi:hypothetical protein